MTGQVSLADLIADIPPTKWIMATVDSVQMAEHAVTLSYHGGLIPHVGYLESYPPAVGDVVHALIDQRNGLLVLGKEVLRPATTPPTPGPVVTAVNTDSGTWNTVSNTWSDGIRQGPEESGAFFYVPAAFTSLVGVTLAKVEIRLTLAADSQALSLVLHDNADTSAPFTQVGSLYLHKIEPEVDTWVALPMAWANALVNDDAKGIGLASDIYTAVVSAGGTLRFTPL